MLMLELWEEALVSHLSLWYEQEDLGCIVVEKEEFHVCAELLPHQEDYCHL